MTSAQARRSPREIGAILVVLAVGLGLRLYHLGTLSLWTDEGYTYLATQLPWSTLLTTAVDTHPPLYNLLQKLTSYLGSSEFVLRLTSSVAGTGAIYATYAIGRRFVGPACGLAAAAVLATSSLHIQYSQEARSYALLFLLLTMATYSYLVFITDFLHSSRHHEYPRNNRQKFHFFSYAALILAALYTHNVAIFFYAVVNALFLVHAVLERRWQDPTLFMWAVGNGLIALAWLPWIYTSIGSAPALDWLTQVSLGQALATTLKVLSFTYSGNAALAVAVVGPVLVGIAIVIKRRAWPLASLLVGVGCALPLAVWLAGYFQPIFMPRTILQAMLAGALAVGVWATAPVSRMMRIAVPVIVVALNLAWTVQYFRNHEKWDWREAVRVLVENVEDDDGVLLCDGKLSYLALRYYHAEFKNVFGWNRDDRYIFAISDPAFLRYQALPLEMRLGMPPRLVQETLGGDDAPVRALSPLTERFPRMWLIQAHCSDDAWNALTAALERAQWTAVSSRSFSKVELTEWLPPSGER